MSQPARPDSGPANGPTPPDEPSTRLVSWSSDRTLVVEPDSARLLKIYDRGSMADAKAEASMGAMLRIDGVVRYQGVGSDAKTGRPCVALDYHRGCNIEHWIAEHGPFEPRDACRLAHRLARTLAEMHASSFADAPHGVIHRDIKPSNVYLVGEPPDPQRCDVLLLDLEHAVPWIRRDGIGETGVFTGGSHGFAPPESYRGAPPSPAFDAFGFGVTLHTMLTGHEPFPHLENEQDLARALQQPRLDYLRGLPEAVTRLVSACLATDAAARPTMADAAAMLEEVLATATEEESALDRALIAIWQQDLHAAADLLRSVQNDDQPRRNELARMLRQRARLLKRVAPLPEPRFPAEPEQLATWLAETAPRLSAWVRRFPRSPAALALGREVSRGLGELLRSTPLAASKRKRAAKFDEAVNLVESTLRATRAVSELPRHPPQVGGAAETLIPGPMQRDPVRYLELSLRDLREASRQHAELLGQLHRGEATLDLDEVHRVLDSVATVYSGASTVVATLKDRAHRLGFYLERISHPSPALDDVREQLALAEIDLDLSPLVDFQRLCADKASGHRLEGPAPKRTGPRVLQRMLRDLLTEFPQAREAAGQAVSALGQAMELLTDFCWQLIEDGRHKLDLEPIPVKPLQTIVHRIDTLRRLEILIDRPERSRADLLDEHEQLRMNVDQARAARDRLARGAEEAMERGHWTTALYDMERAVDRLSHEETDTSEIDRNDKKLVEQLEKARRRKESVDTATAENMRLAARYAELQDDPTSNHKARLGVLERRRKVLRMLTRSLQAERVGPYRDDLHEVGLAIAQEKSDHAESLLSKATTGKARERIAQEALEMLATSDTAGSTVGRRMQLLLERWQRHLDQAQADRGRRRGRRGYAAPRARTAFYATSVVAIAAVVASGLWFSGVFDGVDPLQALATELADDLRQPTAPRVSGEAVEFDSTDALDELSRVVARLDGEPSHSAEYGRVVETAGQLLGSVREVVNRSPAFDAQTWASGFAGELGHYREAVDRLDAGLAGGSPLVEQLDRLGRQAHVAGLFTGLTGAVTEDERETLADTLAEMPGFTLPADMRDSVRQLLK